MLVFAAPFDWIHINGVAMLNYDGACTWTWSATMTSGAGMAIVEASLYCEGGLVVSERRRLLHAGRFRLVKLLLAFGRHNGHVPAAGKLRSDGDGRRLHGIDHHLDHPGPGLMHVYTLQAHRIASRSWPTRSQALRSCLTPDKIIVVQGPYGRHGDTDRRLTAAIGRGPGRRNPGGPRLPAGGTYAKQPALYAWLLNEAIPEKRVGGHSARRLLPHPATDLARLARRPRRRRPRPPRRRKVRTFTTPGWPSPAAAPTFAPPHWSGDFRLWPATREEDYETCEPGWWHADRVNLWHRTEAGHKLAEIRQRFPAAIAAETEAAGPPASRCPAYDPETQVFAFTEPRKLICYGCTDRPEGCWKNRDFGCTREYKKAEEARGPFRPLPAGQVEPTRRTAARRRPRAVPVLRPAHAARFAPSRRPCRGSGDPHPRIATAGVQGRDGHRHQRGRDTTKRGSSSASRSYGTT